MTIQKLNALYRRSIFLNVELVLTYECCWIKNNRQKKHKKKQTNKKKTNKNNIHTNVDINQFKGAQNTDRFSAPKTEKIEDDRDPITNNNNNNNNNNTTEISLLQLQLLSFPDNDLKHMQTQKKQPNNHQYN
ncbi:hypothetical protein PAMA_019731 [Pampus argenteus]